ncbi:MAG: serine/threonine protein kinase, partial [Myxococcales bacterium]|nr:serine/threonine protein kinase [Myxococcales bacterium]
MREHVQPPPTPAVDAAALTGAAVSPGPTSTSPSLVTAVATGVPARPDPAVDPLLGTTLADRYRIDRRLGAGGMGAVYAGFHLALNKRVALKVIQPRLGADPTIAQRFVQEAHAASAIGHEHIVHITDLGTEGGTAFLVMEYLDGEDLAETLRREGPLPWQRVIHIGEQIAWALSAAHRQGIIHRDIKPANCYRVPREHDPDFIKVLDFGLAKVLAASPGGESLTGTGMLLGTPGYIAPELYRGLRADHRVDIYALGALMHKLLTGELPAMASGSGADDRLATLAAPGAVLAVLGRALAEAPDDRHATAQDLAQALRNIPRVSADAPTQLGPPGQSGPDLTTLSGGPSGGPTRDTSSAQAITLREPTPASFPSLFTVEHDGKRVRFYIGAPLVVVLLTGVAALIWWLTRPVSFITQAQQEARVSINGGKAADAARTARARADLPPGTATITAPPTPNLS